MDDVAKLNAKYNLSKYYTEIMFRDVNKKKGYTITNLYCIDCKKFYKLNGCHHECPGCNRIVKTIEKDEYKNKEHILNIFYIIEVINKNCFNLIRIDKIVDISNFDTGEIVEKDIIRGYINYNYEDDVYAYVLKENGKFKKTTRFTNLISPKGNKFTKTEIIGMENIKDCSNFFLKTGYKEIEIMTGLPWKDEIEKFINYIEYNSNNNNKRNNQMELLVKAGYKGIVKSKYFSGNYKDSKILNREGTKIKDLIKLPKEILKLVKELNEVEILKLEEIHEKGGGLSVEFIRYLKNNIYSISPLLLMSILETIDLGFTNKEIHSYLIKTNLYQAISCINTLELWRDYISMAQLMDVPYKKFPNSLKKEHDLMTRNYKYQKDEIIEKQFEKRGKELSCLEYQGDEYIIKAPRTTKELVEEGSFLQHCVASYIERMAENKTSILFLRKKRFPEEPFYTIEMRSNIITQIKGFANKAPSNEIKKFIKEWEKEKIV